MQNQDITNTDDPQDERVYSVRNLPIQIDWELDDADISDKEMRLYVHLARRSMKKGHAWPKIETMEKHLSWSRRTVRRAIAALEEKGMIKVTRIRDGLLRRNIYEILPKECWTCGSKGHLHEGSNGTPRGDNRAPTEGPNGTPLRGHQGPGKITKVEDRTNIRKGGGAGAKKADQKPGPESLEGFKQELTESADFQTKWAEWVTYRRAKRKPISQLAATKQKKTLNEFTPEECCGAIDKAIESDWASLYPKKTNNANRSGGTVSDAEQKRLGF